jgi:hypothetical protein
VNRLDLFRDLIRRAQACQEIAQNPLRDPEDRARAAGKQQAYIHAADLLTTMDEL